MQRGLLAQHPQRNARELLSPALCLAGIRDAMATVETA